MKLSKILLLPIALPYAVYVFARVLKAKGVDGGINHLRKSGESFEARMAIIDALLPQGSHTHKRAVRELRKEYRKRIKEAYVKKS